MLHHDSITGPEDNGRLFSLLDIPKDLEIKYYKYFNQMPLNKKIGEKTPSYMILPSSIHRIKRIFPNTKIIIILRNPVDRFISAFNTYMEHHPNATGEINQVVKDKINLYHNYFNNFNKINHKTNFEIYSELYHMTDNDKWMDQKTAYLDPHYILRGLYYYQIDMILQYFSKCQVMIIENLDFQNNLNQNLERLYNFLGLPLDQDYTKLPIKMIKSHNNKYHLNIETRKMLENFYKPFNEKLYTLIGKRFDWNKIMI